MIWRVILALIVLYVMYRVLKKMFRLETRKVTPLKDQGKGDSSMEDLVEDTVCHTYLPVSKAIVWEDEGTKKFFCSEECLKIYRESKKKKV
ncbi:MAG: hypothetical protein N2572_04265 [Syntrophales bacterium]|nr:hypothetical protein [Syntrophales bacterium]